MRPKPTWHAEARRLCAQGLTDSEIARRVGHGRSGVGKALRAVDGDAPWLRARERKLDRDLGIPGLIPLWKDKGIADFARVDLHDWERLRGSRCWVIPAGYVVANIDGAPVYLHHAIVGRVRRVSGLNVDHINRDRLDNRRCNLRIITAAENQANRGGIYERCWWRQITAQPSGCDSRDTVCPGTADILPLEPASDRTSGRT